MAAVTVEFEVGEGRINECVIALEALTESLVSKQSKFHGNIVLVERNTGNVANMMLWHKASDFDAFRDENRSTIGAVIGHYGPMPRFYEVAGFKVI